jgi:hypothetical protein
MDKIYSEGIMQSDAIRYIFTTYSRPKLYYKGAKLNKKSCENAVA